jgi:predicted transcriptional regulator of viral defense system
MTRSLAALYAIAEPQAGYFTTSQAHVVEVSDQQLHYLAKTGSLERVAHGIYRLKRFPAQPFEDVIVACLWAGDGTAASHDTALAVYGLTDAMPPTIHVTVPRPFRGRRKGVTVHVATLPDDERTTRNGVPVTSPVRTIRDIAARHGPEEAARVANEAVTQGLVTRTRLTRDMRTDEATHHVLERLGLAR